MLAEEILQAPFEGGVHSAATAHPMNSSRLLLQLISLHRSETPLQNADALIQRSALRSLMLALQYRDPAIVKHCRRVASLGVAIAQHLGWEDPELHVIEAACLLHDIGKIGIPDLILQKPGRLTPEEAELVTLIDDITCDVLQACQAHEAVIRLLNQLPYHFNGASHGFRVIGSDMQMGSRILSVVDAYDSLITQQVFRERYSHVEALEILSRNAGSKFDGNVISALGRWLEMSGRPDQLESDQPEYSLSAEDVLEAGSTCHVFSYLYLLESLYDGFYISRPDGSVIVWNSGLERLTGVPWHQARGKRVTNFLQFQTKHGEPLTGQASPIRAVTQTGRSQTDELQLKRSNDWCPVEVQTMPLLDDNGVLHGFAQIVRDLRANKSTPGDRDLRLMASRDALTHVANRGELKAQLELKLKAYHETGCREPFSVIFLDVDHFKRTNDTYGHAAGDEVLVSIARLIQHETYSGEFVARYGGEEFIILCPETRLQDGFHRAERLRKAMSQARVVKSDEFRITASFGVAEVEPSDTGESLLGRADKALYMSKRQGRNRTNKLTSEELRQADPNMVEPPVDETNSWLFESKLRACIAANMIVYKLRAFVDEHSTKLMEVRPEHVRMRLGQRGLVPFWGSNPDRQPVELLLEFGEDRNIVERGASKLVDIRVRITPLGWVTDPDVFQTRAKAVMRELREYFAADLDTTDL